MSRPGAASRSSRCRSRPSTRGRTWSPSRWTDIALNKVCLAWIASRRSRLIYDFAELAADIDWTAVSRGTI